MDAPARRLRAAAEPTRLRLLALAARGAFCVMEFTEILGQSQPRLSRHLKLLCECGLLDAGARRAPTSGSPCPTARTAPWRANWSPACRPTTRSWRPTAARPPACWPNAPASPRESFRRKGADWDEMRALDLPAAAVEAALLRPGAARTPRPRCWISAPAPAACWNCWPRASRAGAGRRRVQGDAGAGPRPPVRAGLRALRGAAGRHVPAAAGRRLVRHRRAADGAAPRRGPRRRAGRGRARAAPGRHG